MTAGERLFVDFCPMLERPAAGLPPKWSANCPNGPAPPSVRFGCSARMRKPEAAAGGVRASVQPTFVRFVFENADGVGVSSVLNDQKLTLLFQCGADIRLADARWRRRPNIARSIRGGGRFQHRGSRADRRCRRAFVPRGKELHRRRRVPASRKAASRAPTQRLRRAGALHPSRRRKAADESAPERQQRGDAADIEMIAQQAKIEIGPEMADKVVPPPPPLAEQLRRSKHRLTSPRDRKPPPASRTVGEAPRMKPASPAASRRRRAATNPLASRRSGQRRHCGNLFLCTPHRRRCSAGPTRWACVRFHKTVRCRADPDQRRCADR